MVEAALGGSAESFPSQPGLSRLVFSHILNGGEGCGEGRTVIAHGIEECQIGLGNLLPTQVITRRSDRERGVSLNVN
jgi:hypothetical protein